MPRKPINRIRLVGLNFELHGRYILNRVAIISEPNESPARHRLRGLVLCTRPPNIGLIQCKSADAIWQFVLPGFCLNYFVSDDLFKEAKITHTIASIDELASRSYINPSVAY